MKQIIDELVFFDIEDYPVTIGNQDYAIYGKASLWKKGYYTPPVLTADPYYSEPAEYEVKYTLEGTELEFYNNDGESIHIETTPEIDKKLNEYILGEAEYLGL